MKSIYIGWTTLASRDQAKELAEKIIQEKLAACVQISGPVSSIYFWEGGIQEEKEYRLTLKLPGSKLKQLEAFLEKHHPYEVHQWVAVESSSVSEGYAKWALGSCN